MPNSDTPEKVGDYVKLQRGSTYKGDLVGSPGPPLLGLGSIEAGGGFRIGKFRTFGGECPAKWMVQPGSIYVALKGATKDGSMVGSVARLPTDLPSGRLTQDTARLDFFDTRPETANYLYWILRTPQYRAYCDGRVTGSASASFSREDFLEYPIPRPTSCAMAIVETLETAEQKIEQNRRTGRKLEELARATFKAWFVDFEPVKAKATGATAFPGMPAETFATLPTRLVDCELGPVPEGWELGSMGEIGLQRREQVKPDEVDGDTPYIGLEHMPRRDITLSDWGNATSVTSSKFRFRRSDILFGKLRPYFHKVGPAPLDGVCSTDIVVLYSKRPEHTAWLLMLVSSDDFVAHTDRSSAGTKMPRTNWKDMTAFSSAIPPLCIAAAFQDQVGPMLDLIAASIQESRRLAALRDYVLPRLLSGRVRVRDVERMN